MLRGRVPQPEQVIRERLTGIGALVILDNCEHVRQPCSEFAQRLLEGVFDLKIVATSRDALGVAGERQFVVGPMSLSCDAALQANSSASNSDAIQLFLTHVSLIQPTLELDEANVDVIQEICKRLDGIPLAIELPHRG